MLQKSSQREQNKNKNKAEKFSSHSTGIRHQRGNLVVVFLCVNVNVERRPTTKWKAWDNEEVFVFLCFIICEMTIREIKCWKTYRRVNCERMITNWKVFLLTLMSFRLPSKGFYVPCHHKWAFVERSQSSDLRTSWVYMLDWKANLHSLPTLLFFLVPRENLENAKDSRIFSFFQICLNWNLFRSAS